MADPPVLVDAEEAGRRVRTALAYADLEQADVAKRTGISKDVLRRITSRTNPRGAPVDQLWAIADACRVPRSFMTEGFQADATLDEKIEATVRRLIGPQPGGLIDPPPPPDQPTS